MKWNNEIGWATVVGIFSFLGVLVAVGIAWGSLQGDVKASTSAAAEAKATIAEQTKHAILRDKTINEHSVTLGEIKTTLGYIGPAMQRIESKLDTAPKP